MHKQRRSTKVQEYLLFVAGPQGLAAPGKKESGQERQGLLMRDDVVGANDDVVEITGRIYDG